MRFLSPNELLWVEFELILLGVAVPEEIVANQVEQDNWGDGEDGLVVGVVEQVVALN